MAEQVILSNGTIKVSFTSIGAEMTSVIKDGVEKIWQADPEVWAKHAPTLFPICGGLNNDTYTYKGNSYSLPRHGFARPSLFEVEEKTETSATFLLRSNEETLKCYPFHFEFRVKYSISGSTLTVTYDTRNTGDENMYYSLGGHDAYNCPEGVNSYSVIFEKPEDLDSNLLVGPVLGHELMNFGKNTTELQLKEEFFELDTLAFLNLKSRKAWLKNRETGDTIEIGFDGFDYFMIWTKVGAKFICLEPWCGLSDYFDAGSDITQKAGIMTLSPNERQTKTRTVTF